MYSDIKLVSAGSGHITDIAMPGRLQARRCHAFPVFNLLAQFSMGLRRRLSESRGTSTVMVGE